MNIAGTRRVNYVGRRIIKYEMIIECKIYYNMIDILNEMIDFA